MEMAQLETWGFIIVLGLLVTVLWSCEVPKRREFPRLRCGQPRA